MKVEADEYYLFQKAADEMLVGDKRWRSVQSSLIS